MSAGRCNICRISVVERDVKIGEMAHIIAKRMGGPRGRGELTGQRDGYENLILLCPNHHAEVDRNEIKYPPHELHRIKAEHENYISKLLNTQHQGRGMDVQGLSALVQHLPLTRIPSLLQRLPEIFEMEIIDAKDACLNFEIEFPHCRPFSDSTLEAYFSAFLKDLCEVVDCAYLITNSHESFYEPNSYRHNLHLARNLTSEQVNWISGEVDARRSRLLEKNGELISYLKRSYSEINLSKAFG